METVGIILLGCRTSIRDEVNTLKKEMKEKITHAKIHLIKEDDQTGKAEQTELYFDLIFVAAMFRLGNMVVSPLASSKHTLARLATCYLATCYLDGESPRHTLARLDLTCYLATYLAIYLRVLLIRALPCG